MPWAYGKCKVPAKYAAVFCSLSFTTLWANSADDKLAIFFFFIFLPEKKVCYFM